jgi:hypothetical protein
LKWLWRGFVAFGVALSAVTTAIKGYRETLRDVQELVGHDAVTGLLNKFSELSLTDATLLIVGVFVTSLFVWVLHTAPRERGKKEFHDELESRKPGITKRKPRSKRK